MNRKELRIFYLASHAPVDYTTSDAYFALPNFLSKNSELTLACPPPPKNKHISFENDLAGLLCFDNHFSKIPAVARKVARFAVNCQYHLIITGVDERSLLPGLYASSRTGCKHIAVCEDHPFQSRYDDWKNFIKTAEQDIRIKLLRLLLKRPNRILCFIEKEVLGFLGIPTDRLVQLRNGIDDTVLSLRNEKHAVRPFAIGYIGAVEESKGSLEMLTLLSKVRQRCPAATLTLVGPYASEEHRSVFQQHQEKLGLNGSVQVTGYVRHKEALEFLQRCTVCVHAYRPLPWLYYNQALKVAEYMAIGKAVVSWDYPGVKRLLNDGSAGLLVEPGNLNMMAEAIVRLLTQDDVRTKMEKYAYDFAANQLAWSNIGEEVLETIIDTITG